MPHEDIPVIQTDRLILRGPTPDDYPDFEVLFRSRQSRFMGGPLNEYETWMLYAAEMGHWQIRGFGMWAITEKGSDHSLGLAGGWFPAGYPEREIAWMIWPGVEGRGIALEAVTAARAYCFDTLGWDGAVSYLDPHNIRSVDLALRLGAVLDPTAPTVDSHEVVYRHVAADREAA